MAFEVKVRLKDIDFCEAHLKLMEQKLIQHYQSEQLQLFSKVFDNPKLKEGGAFCTYYFDTFMNHRPLAKLTQLLKRIKPEFKEPTPSIDTLNYFTTGSPLAIPCEEHLAILSLVQELRIELKSKRQVDWNWIESATQLLKTWMKTNHEKEEHCLFPHLLVLLI